MKLSFAVALLIPSTVLGDFSLGKKGGFPIEECPIEMSSDLVDVNGTLTACVSTGSSSCGEARFITTEGSCGAGEVEVEWGTTGPEGPEGA